MNCQICLEKSTKMVCGHYAHYKCLQKWKEFHPSYIYNCLECGKKVNPPFPFKKLSIFICFVFGCFILNNIYTIDYDLENHLLLQYDELVLKMFSNKVQINHEIMKYCEEESVLEESLNIVLFRLRHREIKLLNDSSIFKKAHYLFSYINSEYPETNTFCKKNIINK
jgi:hypothetical protein